MKKLRNLVESSIFQNIVLGVIIFNAILMGIQTSKTMVANYGNILNILDYICLGVFIIELLLKIVVYNKDFIKDGWNIFDFIVVIISVVPNMGTFSVLRIFRILKEQLVVVEALMQKNSNK